MKCYSINFCFSEVILCFSNQKEANFCSTTTATIKEEWSSSSTSSSISIIIIINSRVIINISVLIPVSIPIFELFIFFLLFYINVPHHFFCGTTMELKLHNYCVLSLPPHLTVFNHSLNFNEFIFVHLLNIRFICDGERYLLTYLNMHSLFVDCQLRITDVAGKKTQLTRDKKWTQKMCWKQIISSKNGKKFCHHPVQVNKTNPSVDTNRQLKEHLHNWTRFALKLCQLKLNLCSSVLW